LGLGGLLIAGCLAITSLVTPFAGATRVSAADALGAGGEYHALTPARIFDSRAGLPGSEHDVAPLGAKPVSGTGSTFDVQLLGLGGVPASASEVLGVVANITVTDPTTSGYLNAYGSGEAAGAAAIINFVPGQTVPNLAIVRPGSNGKLTVVLAAGSGSANVVIDVFGWFSTSSSATRGARLVPVTPGRIFDSRIGLNRTPTGPLAAGETVTIPIRGVDAVDPARTDIVPADTNVVGVVLNMAGVNNLSTSTNTHLSVIPSDLPAGQKPSTANLNLSKGLVKSNMVIVPVDPTDGSIRLFNNAGTTDVVLDVVGYLIANRDVLTRAGRIVPLASPFRVFDTREAKWNATPLGAGQAEDWSFSDFASSVTIGGVSVGNQMGVIGNLTAASLVRQFPNVPVGSYLTVYPTGDTRPTSANLNMIEGPPPVPNMTIMKYGPSATVRVYNFAGNVHYVYDASAVILSD
jgi:hypothetical protein